MAALRQKVKLLYDLDGTEHEVVVEYTAVDVRAWETKHGKSALTTDTSFSMLTWFAHHAGVRTGAIDGELKDYKRFDAVCTDVAGVRDEVPTTAGDPATPETAGESSSAD